MRGGLEHNTKKLQAFHFLSSLHLIGGVLIPFYTMWGGLNMAQVMLLQSVFMLALFGFEVPTGAVADRFGRKATLVMSGLITAASLLLYTAAPKFELFLAGEVLFALGAALQNGADDALLVDSLKALGKEHELGSRISRQRMFSLAGLAVGSTLGGVLAQFTDLRAPFLATAIPLVLSSLLAASLAEPPNLNGRKKSVELMKDGLRHFRQNRHLQLLSLELASVSTVGYFVIWLNQAALMQAGVPIAYLGLVQSALVGAQVAVLLATQRLRNLLGTVRLARLFPAFTGVGLAAAGLLLMGHGQAALLAGSLLLAGGFGLSQEAFLQPSMQRLIPSEKRATVSSVVTSVKELGKGAANPLVGIAADFSLGLTLLGLGGAALAVAVLSPARKALEVTE